jgi:uncharacterized protein (DUF983 family)
MNEYKAEYDELVTWYEARGKEFDRLMASLRERCPHREAGHYETAYGYMRRCKACRKSLGPVRERDL